MYTVPTQDGMTMVHTANNNHSALLLSCKKVIYLIVAFVAASCSPTYASIQPKERTSQAVGTLILSVNASWSSSSEIQHCWFTIDQFSKNFPMKVSFDPPIDLLGFIPKEQVALRVATHRCRFKPCTGFTSSIGPNSLILLQFPPFGWTIKFSKDLCGRAIKSSSV